MSNGIYQLTETDAPPGYIIRIRDIYFSVSDGAVTLTDDKGKEETYSEVVLKDNNTTIEVKNSAGVPLPYTGGPGTGFFIGSGALLLALAGLLYLIRRKVTGTLSL